MEQAEREKILESIPDALSNDELTILLEKLQSKSHKSMDLESWREEIANAKKNGFFEVSSIKAAKNWGTCAVGARLQVDNPKMARYFNDQFVQRDNTSVASNMLTEEASNLGSEFYHAVEANDPISAEKIFNKIQKLPLVLQSDEDEQKTKKQEKKLEDINEIKKKNKYWIFG